ncbi:DUF4097 family beta strand repeat-containing protein [Lewinella sp. IMCC34183]|uniref:DUF4097 family beta strand repeat-containing protein n=1 Tax=Lewinella sp. IMCC34183 TaxID=2248762 RepID=UPI00130020CB|nr:DUF4097 family beta strand repeat-containing protein [Lewinella sp. IMCC34183]
MKSNAIYLSTLLFLLFSATVTANADPTGIYEKKLSETFAISANGSVQLDNRYGEIKVNTWNQPRVRIDVLIRVEAGSESEFQDVLKRVNVSLTGGGDRVSGVTSIESTRKRGSWWTYILSSDDVNDFKVYYTVNMPATVKLQVDARYCDVELPNLSGTTRLDVGYGDLVAGRLDARSEVDISYGSARIERLGNESTVKFRYSEGTVRNAGNMSYDGRYSDVRFGAVGDLRLDVGYEEVEVEKATSVRLEGNYNDLSVGEVGEAYLSGSYTDFNLGTVLRVLEVRGNYGDLEVDRLAAGFQRVNVEVSYSDVQIGVDADAGYTVDLSARYGDIDIPTDRMTSRNTGKDGMTEFVKGKRAGSGSGTITIATSYGDIEIY